MAPQVRGGQATDGRAGERDESMPAEDAPQLRLANDPREVVMVLPERGDRLALGDVPPRRTAGEHPGAEECPVAQGCDVCAEEVHVAAGLGEFASVFEDVIAVV